MNQEQIEQIKERATDLLHEIDPTVDRVAIRNTVDLYVKVLDKATIEVMRNRPMTEEEIVAHDAAVGIPGWKKVDR